MNHKIIFILLFITVVFSKEKVIYKNNLQKKSVAEPTLTLKQKPIQNIAFKDFAIFFNYSLGFGSAEEIISNASSFRKYEYRIMNANYLQTGIELNNINAYMSYAGGFYFDSNKSGIPYKSLSIGGSAYKWTLPYINDIGFAYMLPYVGFESGISYVSKTKTKSYWGWNNTFDFGGVIKLYFTDNIEFKVIVSSTKTFWSLGEIKAIDVVNSRIYRIGFNYKYTLGDIVW